MNMRKRGALIGLVMVVASLPAWAGDKLTEQTMTQKDYQRLTKTESSVEHEPPTQSPVPVHNLSDANEQAITKEGGVKVIPAGTWKKETPAERDAHIRRIRETLPEGARLVVSVPKGDVWLIPGIEVDEGEEGLEDYIYVFLILGDVLRPWNEAQRAALPTTVARDKAISQSDKHGTTPIRAAPESEEP